jgi:flagellar biosynthesis protein FlhG
MDDQANHLRELVRQTGAGPTRGPFAQPKLIVVTGGTGGVGTSTLASGLAIALAQRRQETVFVDADPQGGDGAGLCGLKQPKRLADVLTAPDGLAGALESGTDGLHVVPGVWGWDHPVEPSASDLQRLIEQIRGLEGQAEFAVIDAGNGLSYSARAWWRAADLVVVTMRLEVASVMAAYASIKLLGVGRSALVRSVVNRARGRGAADEVHGRLAEACSRFLDLRVEPLGHMPDDPALATVGARGGSLLAAKPGSPFVRQIRRLADGLVEQVS